MNLTTTQKTQILNKVEEYIQTNTDSLFQSACGPSRMERDVEGRARLN